MSDSFFILLLLSGFRLSLPLIFAAYAAYFSERSGVAQIAVESFLLIGAFTAAATAYLTQSLFLSFLLAGLVSALFAQIFCLLFLYIKSHSIIVGTGMNLLAMGLIPIVSKLLFNSTGSTPSHSLESVGIFWAYFILAVTTSVCFLLSEKSVWGLQMKFAGEKKSALESIGVSAEKRQWQSVTIGAFVGGMGGAILSIFMASSYSPMMSAGRGFIALAAVIFSGWSMPKSIAICFLFGLSEAFQIQLQSHAEFAVYIPAVVVQMIPYLLTLMALFIMKEKNQAPAELQ